MARILVIDDDAAVRRVIRRILASKGHEVIEAESGVGGVKLFKDERPDLVVTDIFMPDQDGIETISELRQIEPDIRIIATSGGGSSKDPIYLDFSVQLGADIALLKPFKPADLLQAVANLLDS